MTFQSSFFLKHFETINHLATNMTNTALSHKYSDGISLFKSLFLLYFETTYSLATNMPNIALRNHNYHDGI